MQFATEIRTLTCIRCPMGCMIEVALNSQGAVDEISGYQCQLGKEYAQEEAIAPKRMICTTLPIAGSLEPLSVKTATPIPKQSIQTVLKAINAIEAQAPIEEGAVLLKDVARTGAAVIATKTLLGD